MANVWGFWESLLESNPWERQAGGNEEFEVGRFWSIITIIQRRLKLHNVGVSHSFSVLILISRKKTSMKWYLSRNSGMVLFLLLKTLIFIYSFKKAFVYLNMCFWKKIFYLFTSELVYPKSILVHSLTLSHFFSIQLSHKMRGILWKQ